MNKLIAGVALGVSLALPNISEAHGGGGHGGGGHGGFRGGGGHGGFDRGGFHGGFGGFYGYGFFGDGLGLGYYYGLDPYFYGPGYYNYLATPPALTLAPPVVAQVPAAYWYYCPVAKAYYPYVNACPSGWQAVPAQAAAESR